MGHLCSSLHYIEVMEGPLTTPMASELLGERELDLQVANGTAFLYDSWIEVEFQLLGG